MVYIQVIVTVFLRNGSIFWSVAMFICCSISPNIREGLLEVFYGVYEKDPDKVFFIFS